MSSPLKGKMSNIRPSRVSFVKRPANRRKFLITKSQEIEEMDEIVQIVTKTEVETEETLVETLTAQGKDAQTAEAAISVARILAAFSDSLDEEAFAVIGKAAGFGEQNAEEETEETEAQKTEAEAESVEATNDDAEEIVADDAEPVEKSEEDDAEVAELKARISELEQNRRNEELEAMVAGMSIGKSADELVEVLKSVDAAGPEATQAVVEAFKAANNVIRLGGFGEIGSDMPGVVGGDAFDAIERRAREVMKNENLTYERALDHVSRTEPDLVAEYYK